MYFRRRIPSTGVVPVHRHIHRHIDGHTGEHGRLLGEALVANAARVAAGGEQHLRVVVVLMLVVIIGGHLTGMDYRPFKRKEHVSHVRRRLLVLAYRYRGLILKELLASIRIYICEYFSKNVKIKNTKVMLAIDFEKNGNKVKISGIGSINIVLTFFILYICNSIKYQ